MFRLTMFVEDKKLAPVLNALAGLVINMESPQPVANAVVKNGKIKQAQEGTMSGRVAALVTQRPKGSQITTDEIKEMIALAGGNPNGISTVRQFLFSHKNLKTKERGIYTVL